MKGYYLTRIKFGYFVYLYSNNRRIGAWCYNSFVRKSPHLKFKPGEKIPVNIKITRRKPERIAGVKE